MHAWECSINIVYFVCYKVRLFLQLLSVFPLDPITNGVITIGTAIIIVNSSVHTAIECLLLPTFTNGMISYSPDISPNFDLGTDATYTCDAGFFLDVTAASQVRTCIDDNGMDAIGVWSGQEPSCIRKLSIMNFLEYSCRYFMYRIIAGNFR